MAKSIKEICCDRNELLRYLEESLEEQREVEIQKHLDICPQCQQVMAEVAADQTLWNELPERLATQTVDEPESGDRRIEQLLERLGPTDDPEMLGRLGSYEIIGVIGSGSTGIVLKAFESRLNRFVAIKVLAPGYSSCGAARRRFERDSNANK